MLASEVYRLKEELEKHEKTLNVLSKKWDDESALKRLSKLDQSTVVRAVVSAKRLTTVLIPKLKFKVDLALKSPRDPRLHENATIDWKTLRPKIDSTLKEFEILETGKKADYPTKEQKQRDINMSKNIEKSLKSRRSLSRKTGLAQGEASPPAHFPEDGSGDMGRNKIGVSDDEATTTNLGTGDGSGPSTSADYGQQWVENVKNFKDQLSKRRLPGETLSGIIEDVCPDDTASVKAYLRSLAASETAGMDNVLSQEILDEIRGFDAEEVDRRKAERDRKLAKSKEIREQRIRKIEKLAEENPVMPRATLPSPLPIDGFLDLVETLPGEIQKLVTKETEALTDYYKNQVFLKKTPISSRQGKLVNMNHLKDDHADKRFDASDFHMRVAESDVAKEHIKTMKEHGVDNAVERFFGTFSSRLDFDSEESTGSSKYPIDDMELSFEKVD